MTAIEDGRKKPRADGFIKTMSTPCLAPIIKMQESRPAEGEAPGIVYPPLDMNTILELTYSNAFHTQCISLKAEMAVGLEFEAPKPVEKFLDEISGADNFLDILQRVAFDWECLGNGALEVARDAHGRIGEIYHVHGHTLYVRTEGNQLAGYEQYADIPVEFDGFGARGELNEILHFKRYTPFSSWYGMPDWIAALEALRLDQQKKIFYSSFFKNFAVPSMAVVLEGAEFDAEVEKKLKDGFDNMKGSENAFRTLLLSVPFEGAQIKFEKLMADFKDMPFDKLSQATREEILAAHGVPPRLVGIVTAGSLGGEGEADAQLRNFVACKIKPRMKYLERRVHLLLRDAGLPEEFELKGICPEPPEQEERQSADEGAGRVAALAKMINERGYL